MDDRCYGIAAAFIQLVMHNFNKKFLSFLILCMLVFGFASPVFAQQSAANKAKQVEQKRAAAKQQIHKLRLLEKIETNKLYRNQKILERTEQTLSENKAQYQSAQEELASLEKRLEKLTYDFQELQNATNKRIVQIFKTKRKSYVEFLLSSNNVNNFLDRLYFENIVMKQDKENIRQMQQQTRKIVEVKRQIEMQKRYLASSIKSIDREQKNIQDAISQNEKMIYKLKTDRATWEKAERDLARQSRAIADMINKETVRSEKSQQKITVSGGFIRPVGGPVTSPYGWRIHPIFKRKIYHSGVDLGMPMNSPVKAANSGKVIFVGWYGGYGKVVIIDHGRINGVPTTTLYAHLNSYRVGVGAKVAKGQVIANVGTTGYSTGPHLHFEVRQNGQPTNPFNFIPR